MPQIVYNLTTGDIAAVFGDSETIPTLPTGYGILSAAGNVNDLVDKHVDITGPAVEERDYIRFTGLDTQDVNCVQTHGVQKVDGDTDVDMVGAGDTELVYMQIGGPLMAPTTSGFFEDNSKNLVFGAAAYKLAAGAVAGTMYLYAKGGNFRPIQKELDYV